MAQSIVQKIENGQEIRQCYITGRTYELDKHHIFNGALRKKSEDYGLWVYLNHDVHMKAHGTKQGQEVLKWLKQQGQEAFERRYGHEKFMKEFHKNYL